MTRMSKEIATHAHSVAAALALALGTTVSCAAEPALPATVAAALKAVTDICREVDGKPLTSRAILRADLNADGKEDYVLDVGAVDCEGAASIYGDREKGVSVFIADGKGGAVNAFGDLSYGVSIEGRGAAAKLWLTVMGRNCGKAPARDFASENFCDRALVWNAKSRKLDYAPVATVRMIK
jgi:hypothetical protein